MGDAAAAARREGRLPAEGVVGSLRRHTARGTIINAAFLVGLATLTLIQRVAVAAFLTPAEFGVWGVVVATLFLAGFLRQVGIADRFIQQADTDQEGAFQKFFTVELVLAAVSLVLAAVAIPLFALAYGRAEIIAPGLVVSLAIVANALQSPNIVHYRRMDFARQRKLQAVDPCVAFVVTIPLAIAGAGYWSLVIGVLVGAWCGAAVAVLACPYPLALRLGGGTVRDYFRFSWPLAVARAEVLVVAQAALLIATRTIGLGAAGAISLAISFGQFSRGVDSIVTQTLYPGICAVRDRGELLLEAFTKSNRLALMWGLPFGVAVALFAPDLVRLVIGERWEQAIVVLQAFGIVAAIDQLGFNWTAFLRALDRTRPMALVALVELAAFCVITAPLLVVHGLRGFAAGSIAAACISVAGRGYFLVQILPGFAPLRHVARAVAPLVPAVALVLLARELHGAERTLGLAAAELAAFLLTVAAATAVFERRLLREALSYLGPGQDSRAKR
jgi:O-antigen/teichoic acid export membrane protein